MKKHQFSVYFGTRRLRGGQMIKEHMIIMADDYTEASMLAHHFVKRGEEVLGIEMTDPADGLCFY